MPDMRGILLLPVCLVLGCGGAVTLTSPNGETCTGYPDARSSPYVLPYPVGMSYRLSQGNCSGFGHSDFWKYSYDFDMPIGSVVTAARGGTVIFTYWAASDTGPHDMNAQPNLVFIQHPDSTVAVYSHLKQFGVRVVEGQVVAAGDTLALSGNTGYTANMPHLHFSIHQCASLPGFAEPPRCPALPITFANAIPFEDGPLRVDRVYEAGPLSR
jgi:murein DD-endopeptidase MepM/ murein hydrolase activator NlpD